MSGHCTKTLLAEGCSVLAVYFVQGILGLSRLGVSFMYKDEFHLEPASVSLLWPLQLSVSHVAPKSICLSDNLCDQMLHMILHCAERSGQDFGCLVSEAVWCQSVGCTRSCSTTESLFSTCLRRLQLHLNAVTRDVSARV